MGAVPSARTQDPDDTILLGGIQLELGMSQGDALRKLGVVYTLTHLDFSPGHWAVTRRDGSYLVGQVIFSAEKLTGVNKHWGPDDDQTAGAFARALREAVESVTRGGVHNCTISTGAESAVEGWRTTIECGRHRLFVLAPGPRSNVAPDISEGLSARH
jgi:hypothetical protein